jgi:hypothetical protein
MRIPGRDEKGRTTESSAASEDASRLADEAPLLLDRATGVERAPARCEREPERTSVDCTPGSEKPSHIEGISASVRASVRVWRRLTEILDSGRVAIGHVP